MTEQKKPNKINPALIGFIVLILIAGVAVYYLQSQKTIDPEGDLLKEQAKSAKELLKENQGKISSLAEEPARSIKSISEEEYYRGDFNAKVKMIVYLDYDSEFCATYNDTLKKALSDFGDDLVIAYRYFSLEKNPFSYKAIQAAECAAEYGKFFAMHDRLFENKKEEKVDDSDLRKIFLDLDLNTEEFSRCYDLEKYKEDIELAIAEAENYDIIGAPTTYINNLFYPGARPYENYIDSQGENMKGLKQLIEEELNK